jgi:hypothetical protein
METGQLERFIAQEEARDVEAVSKAELKETLAATIKQPQSEDRTSRSASRGGSSGK